MADASSKQTTLNNKIEQPFGWLPQTIIDGEYNLSAKAIGILLYLNNRPKNWKFYKSDIIKRFKDGEHSIRTGLEELKDVGFLKIKRKRNDKKQIVGTEWIIEVPGKPTTGKPNPGKPDAGESQPTKTEDNETEDIKTDINELFKSEINEILEFYSKHAEESEHLVNHSNKILSGKRGCIRARLRDGFTVQDCKDAILGAIEAIESDKSWWSRQRDLEGIFKTKSGDYVENFAKWHNGDLVNSGLLSDKSNQGNNSSHYKTL